MERSDAISYDEFLSQYRFVHKVVMSCETNRQLINAMKWAEDWCFRMKRVAPSMVKDAGVLYKSVLEK